MPTMIEFQQATLSARARLNDNAIGTRVKDGKTQVVRAEYPKSGGYATVTPLTDWLDHDSAIQFLRDLK